MTQTKDVCPPDSRVGKVVWLVRLQIMACFQLRHTFHKEAFGNLFLNFQKQNVEKQLILL